MPWVRLDGVVSLRCAFGGAVLVPAAGGGQWGQRSGGQGRAELAQKGCWELRAGLCLCMCMDTDGSISTWVPGAGSLVQAFLPAPRRGPAVWGWVGAPRLAGVAVVLCSELGGTVFRAGCRWLRVLGAGAARWARAGAVMRWC